MVSYRVFLVKADPGHYLFFFALDGKFPGVETPELSNPPGWGQKKGENAPSSVSSHSRIVPFGILMCDFSFQLTSAIVIGLAF